jgi:hypothetical protein
MKLIITLGITIFSLFISGTLLAASAGAAIKDVHTIETNGLIWTQCTWSDTVKHHRGSPNAVNSTITNKVFIYSGTVEAGTYDVITFTPRLLESTYNSGIRNYLAVYGSSARLTNVTINSYGNTIFPFVARKFDSELCINNITTVGDLILNIRSNSLMCCSGYLPVSIGGAIRKIGGGTLYLKSDMADHLSGITSYQGCYSSIIVEDGAVNIPETDIAIHDGSTIHVLNTGKLVSSLQNPWKQFNIIYEDSHAIVNITSQDGDLISFGKQDNLSLGIYSYSHSAKVTLVGNSKIFLKTDASAAFAKKEWSHICYVDASQSPQFDGQSINTDGNIIYKLRSVPVSNRGYELFARPVTGATFIIGKASSNMEDAE